MAPSSTAGYSRIPAAAVAVPGPALANGGAEPAEQPPRLGPGRRRGRPPSLLEDGPSVSRRLAALLMSRLLPSASASNLSAPSSGAGTPLRGALARAPGPASVRGASDAEEEPCAANAAGRSVTFQSLMQQALALRARRASGRRPAELDRLRREAAALAERVRATRARQRQWRQEAARLRDALLTQAQTQATALRVMLGAGRRLASAAEAVRGREGRDRVLASFSQLTARRCALAVALGDAFQLHPVAVAVPREPSGRLFGRARCPGLVKREVLLSVLGLPLDGKLCRRAFLYDSYEIDPAQDREASVAVCHAAHLTALLAACLGLPLRYPLLLRGSTSYVLSGYGPAPNIGDEPDAQAANSPSRSLAIYPNPEADPFASPAVAAYPLHCDSDRERPRFGIALYLLNKNVTQLLQAHGMSASGPSHLLANIYKLLAAARSAGI
ncbi:hypothetical protein QBZ16_000031 [Prototheca wickerhamii]|uniref:UV radiation resistance-associated gene protein n=1 Tax=Prototheca wickerhamii TaxID=3111 RepID=A0AAD9MMU0_PROWI|nr:hypothetical protein QBZ16_000031 [Prototheca wickerhamii]